MDKIDNQYIANAIDELIEVLGVKEAANYTEFERLIHAKEIKKCIKAIASQLGLPIEINLAFGSRFQSRGLAKTDSSGQGIEGITAQVSIPNYLPFYGTPALTDFPINVLVSENCKEQPQTLIAVMAHELSHILLHCLRNSHKDNEYYTDLTPMLLGFSAVIEQGRKVIKVSTSGNVTRTQTTTFGYLSDEQFAFARDKITSILGERRRTKQELVWELGQLKKHCSDTKKTLLRFNRFLGYVDEHHNRTIKGADVSRIVSFHQAGYADELEKALQESEGFLAGTSSFCEHLVHYTNHARNLIQQHNTRAKARRTDLSSRCATIRDDTKVLERYIGLHYRIRTAIEMRKV